MPNGLPLFQGGGSSLQRLLAGVALVIQHLRRKQPRKSHKFCPNSVTWVNILLSFAQFEREIIAERTRDKMAATRRKGKWAGGIPVLGYDVDARLKRLVINTEEAERVRAIFALYLEHGALLPVVRELDRRGWRNKVWVTRKGQTRGGRAFTKTRLQELLTNVVYFGQVRYRGELFAGEQEALIDCRACWPARRL